MNREDAKRRERFGHSVSFLSFSFALYASSRLERE
jgi:hypothetical protein